MITWIFLKSEKIEKLFLGQQESKSNLIKKEDWINELSIFSKMYIQRTSFCLMYKLGTIE